MSVIEPPSATTLESSPTAAAAPAAPGLRSATWFWVLLACLVLLGSAGVRAWQARRIEAELRDGRRRPRIDLATLPLQLGTWQGEATRLDPQIARATGADQIVTRRYVDQQTGAAVDVILLYGPAVDMYIHVPENCYPAAGYALAGGPETRVIDAGDLHAPFRSLVYARGEGAQAQLQEVYYSWWYQGHWTPEVGKQKHFERIPSMYKVHLARRVAGRERRDVGNPCESLLRALLPTLDDRLHPTATATATTVAATPPSDPA